MIISLRSDTTVIRSLPAVFMLVCLLLSNNVCAATSAEINTGIEATLQRMREEVSGGGDFLSKANGVLVFPRVIKAGIGIGGEYGEGALRVNGKTIDYYNTAAASIGFQLGAQAKSVVVLFMTDQALSEFRSSEGWKAGVDGSVAIVEWGVGEDLNTTDVKDPVLGFIFNNKGLMYNLTLEGSKFTKIKK